MTKTAIEPPSDAYRQFSCNMLPHLLDSGLLTADVLDGYTALWTRYDATPGAFISVPAQLAVVAEKR